MLPHLRNLDAPPPIYTTADLACQNPRHSHKTSARVTIWLAAGFRRTLPAELVLLALAHALKSVIRVHLARTLGGRAGIHQSGRGVLWTERAKNDAALLR